MTTKKSWRGHSAWTWWTAWTATSSAPIADTLWLAHHLIDLLPCPPFLPSLLLLIRRDKMQNAGVLKGIGEFGGQTWMNCLEGAMRTNYARKFLYLCWAVATMINLLGDIAPK